MQKKIRDAQLRPLFFFFFFINVIGFHIRVSEQDCQYLLRSTGLPARSMNA